VRYRFVINSAAGRVRLESVRALIEREFAGLLHEVAVDPSAAGLEALCRGTDGAGGPDETGGLTIVAVGGDGTVNRVVNTPRPRVAAIGIIPLGTANDLAAALGIPDDPIAACRVIRAGQTRWTDLVGVNAKRFATCGGIGIAAEAAMRTNRWRQSNRHLAGWIPGILYPLAAICEIATRRRPGMLEIRCEGQRLAAETMTLVVSNQARFGGRFWGRLGGRFAGRFAMSPEASNTDGFFDLCEIRAPRSRARMLWVILRAFTGRLDRVREIVRMRGTVATLTATREVRFFGDGEILDVARSFEIRLLPSALRVLTPEGGKR
jgi:YegS/Rv2252/BmrU family lipid kinase